MSDTQYLGLVSDSHGRFGALEKMADAEPHVGAWIHAGDYSRDGDDLALYTDVPVFSVLGNNDLWGGTPMHRNGASSPGRVCALPSFTGTNGMANGV